MYKGINYLFLGRINERYDMIIEKNRIKIEYAAQYKIVTSLF